MFHKLLKAESEEMEFITKMRQEYETIFDTLMDYLNEHMAVITQEIRKDKSALVKSWKSARIASVKFSDALKVAALPPEKTAFADFDNLMAKWGVECI